MHTLHQLIETELEAPALAWKMLAYYWGMSAYGLGPAYQAYMQSDEPQQDKAFNDELNEALNKISGLQRRLTVKERFDRSANFYMYCYEQGKRTSINPPYDMPPTLDELATSRLRMEPKSSSPDELIAATELSILGDSPRILKLWEIGSDQQRESRSQAYNERVRDSINYITNQIESYGLVTPDQLCETGFLTENMLGQRFNVTAELMDETMSEEVQDLKFGECRQAFSSLGSTTIIQSGIFGAYYTMGHNLQLAMYNEESKSRLSSTYYAILRTWRQLYDISKRYEL